MKRKINLSFSSIFRRFLEARDLKVVYVGSSTRAAKPNTAPKMLVAAESPNVVYYVDFRFTTTFRNVRRNPRASIAFMDDSKFTGYRLSGRCAPLDDGPGLRRVRQAWERRLNRYLAARIIERVKGNREAGRAEMDLPKDVIIMKFEARDAAVVKPDRVLRGRFR